MELEDIYYKGIDYIETASGNKVCRKSVLCGSQNIVLSGKTIIQSDCIIRGDLGNIKIGRHCVLSSKSIIRPPFKVFRKGVAYLPVTIGDHVFIGENTILGAISVGSYVYIGKNCVIGRHCVLKDCCAIADDTYLPQGTTVPPFAIFSGFPGKFIDELPDSAQSIVTEFTRGYYHHFKPKV